MPANTTPIWSATPNIGFSGLVTAANTAMGGTGTVNLIFTAGSNGGIVESIRFKAGGTNVQTVARIFGNNGSTNTVATNNFLLYEQTLLATTASATAALAEYELWLNKKLPAGFRLYFVLGTAVASGWQATAFGGDY